MFVKPKEGLSVRCPVKGRPLPAEGTEVPDNTFWYRRLAEGDVMLTQQEVATTAPAKQIGGHE